MDLLRRTVSETLGTTLLLATVVGSGIMGERLAGGNIAVALLANTVATGAALVALILTFGQISGAHFNPAVTISDALMGGLKGRDVTFYLGGQTIGAIAGVAAANVMFDFPFSSLQPKRAPAGRNGSASSSPRSDCLPSFGDASGSALPSSFRSPSPLTSPPLIGLPRLGRLQIRQSPWRVR